MNVLKAIPPQMRLLLYVVYGIGSVVATYLGAKSYIGAEELALWTGIGAVFSLTAGSNVELDEPVHHGRH